MSGCDCRVCYEAAFEVDPTSSLIVFWQKSQYMGRYFFCSICGNKRCPHATHHVFLCTNSNEPGQLGSDYE